MQAARMIDDVTAQGERFRQEAIAGGGGGGDTTDGPLVTVSCAGFSPTEVQNDESFTLRAQTRLENNTDDPHTIRWNVEVGGVVVASNQAEVPGGDSITVETTKDFGPATREDALPDSGDVDVVIQQRFGFQQSDTCGTLTVTRPAGAPTEGEEPTAGVDIGELIQQNPTIAVGIIGAIVLFFVLG